MSRQSKALNRNAIIILRKYVEGEISRSEASKQCAVSERTILKREQYYGKRFTSRKKLVTMIENYITYYNNCRM